MSIDAPRPLFAFCAMVTLVLAIVACSGCERPVKICPTSGSVRVNGKPAEGAYVVFHATNDPKRAQSPDTARTGSDGTFLARLRGPGEYAVTVFWPKVTKDAVETVEGEDRLNGKYRKAEQPVTKTSIQNGENSLSPLDLKYP